MKIYKQTTGLADILAHALTKAFENHDRVIWLLCGGSNIPISRAAMKLLPQKFKSRLTVMQTDERFVDPESMDCNWHALMAGGFALEDAAAYPIVDGKHTLAETAERYAERVKEQFARAEYIIAQFGIGANGHIAGIMPDSVASRSKDPVVGYDAGDFKRVTLTFDMLREADEAYTFAYGSTKKEALTNLAEGKMSRTELPAGIVQEIPISNVYTDQIENSL